MEGIYGFSNDDAVIIALELLHSFILYCKYLGRLKFRALKSFRQSFFGGGRGGHRFSSKLKSSKIFASYISYLVTVFEERVGEPRKIEFWRQTKNLKTQNVSFIFFYLFLVCVFLYLLQSDVNYIYIP